MLRSTIPPLSGAYGRSRQHSHRLNLGGTGLAIALAVLMTLVLWYLGTMPAHAQTSVAVSGLAVSEAAVSEISMPNAAATLATPRTIFLPMSAYGTNAQPAASDKENTPKPVPTKEPAPEPKPEKTPAPTATPAPELTPKPTPVSTPVPTAECKLNVQEQGVAALMISHPEQGRAQLICDPILAEVARARAADMAKRKYFDHTNPDGHGPNYLVTQAGYVLPHWYSQELTANNLESIGAGYATVQALWDGGLTSPSHRRHVLASEAGNPVPFYAAQQAYGIGYWHDPASPYRHYWVVITAPLPPDK